MNKKEIAEIKKTLTKDNCCVHSFITGYVTEENELVSLKKDHLTALSEEEIELYTPLLKKVLTGKDGKNLLTVDFSTEEEYSGGMQHALLQLRNSELKDEAIARKYICDFIIPNVRFDGKYAILLAMLVYDIPGTEGKDSEEVYSSILCAICPLQRNKMELSLQYPEKLFGTKFTDWIIKEPMQGFLFPAFNNRNTDIHAALAYGKNSEELTGCITELLHCKKKLTSEEQKNVFRDLIDCCEDKDLSLIMELLEESVEDMTDNDRILSEKDVCELFENCGATEDDIDRIKRRYNAEKEEVKEDYLQKKNLFDSKRIVIQSDGVKVELKTDYTHLLKKQIIDGRECLVIAIEGNLNADGIIF